MCVCHVRNENARKNTLVHLITDHEFNYCMSNDEGEHRYELILRATDDYRKSWEYKKEHLKKIQEEYDILWYADDDLSCIMIAKELGIKTIWYEANDQCSHAKENYDEYMAIKL